MNKKNGTWFGPDSENNSKRSKSADDAEPINDQIDSFQINSSAMHTN